jgi:hypothetical protein
MPAGIVYDEHVRLVWLDAAPADATAITAAEVADGTDLSGYVVPDGVAFNLGNSRVSGADLLSAFDAESMGRYQASPSITFKRRLRGSNDEVAYTTLGARGVEGTLVIFPFIDAGADPAAGDDYYAFTGCETGLPLLQNTAVNAEQAWVCDLAVGGDVILDGVVAA